MTQPEFMRGWIILTSQPWGKPYRTQGEAGQIDPGDVQLELYFERVKACDGIAWARACKEHAAGERWPSLDQLMTTMAAYRSTMPRIARDEPDGISMEEALEERPDLLAVVKRVMA